jgi:hypothetical protein
MMLEIPRMRTSLVVLALVACGNSAPQWHDPATKQATLTIAGTAYTIDLASDMVADKSAGADEASYQLKGDGYSLEVTVRRDDSTVTLEQVVAEPQILTVTATTRREALPDGFVLSVQQHDGFEVKVGRVVGDGTIRCRAVYFPLRKADPVTGVVPFLEKMCLSLKAAK